MNSSRVDIMLDLVPQDEMISFFCRKKTEISHGMYEPLLFLNQLQDYDLVPEDLYQTVIKMKSKERRQNGVYQILEWVEKQGEQCIRLFWKCVFQDHILMKYPFLRSLLTSLLEERILVEVDESSEDLNDYREEEDREQQEEEEEVCEPVDLTHFESAVLPVSCGSVSGNLYKSRFAGSYSKSICTDERWFTPEEFIQQELTLTDGHWEKDILCYGKTLNYLVKKKVLNIHSLLCHCELCCPDDPLDQFEDDMCFTVQDKELGSSQI